MKGNLSYESKVVLTPQCVTELKWWIESINQWNGKSMIRPSPDMTITTDASMTGWGAHCGEEKTQGLWTEEEKKLHINALELKAVLFALKSFLKSMTKSQVLVKTDNTTTVAYINKMGGTKSSDLIQITKELWQFCMDRKIMITAEHLAGKDNITADQQSREYRDSSNWRLDTGVFQEVESMLGQSQVDLFADRMNAQKKKFYSWKPDPEAVQTDAFCVKWTELEAYAFPPFCLLGRVLAKVRQDQATLIMIAPTWQTQPRYPELLSLLVEDPVLLPPMVELLRAPNGDAHGTRWCQ